MSKKSSTFVAEIGDKRFLLSDRTHLEMCFYRVNSNEIANHYGRLSRGECNKYVPKNFWDSTF